MAIPAALKEKYGLSGRTLKIIAVISMLIDHLTAGLLARGYWAAGHQITKTGRYLYYVLRGIGRIAFPIYCFLLIEGYIHTRNKWKYLLRLSLFGLISEIPFDITFNKKYFYWGYQNVFFTLALGLFAVILFDLIVEYDFETATLLRRIAGLAVVGAIAGIAELMKTDYSWYGVLIILCFYIFRQMEEVRNLSVIIVLYFLNVLELVGVLDFVLLHFYNGKRGRQSKYFFYSFYPGHLLLISFARYLLFGIFVR